MLIYYSPEDIEFIKQNNKPQECVRIMKYLMRQGKMFNYDIGCPIPISIHLEFVTPIDNTVFMVGGLAYESKGENMSVMGPIGIQKQVINHANMNMYSITLKEPEALPLFKNKNYTKLFAYPSPTCQLDELLFGFHIDYSF